MARDVSLSRVVQDDAGEQQSRTQLRASQLGNGFIIPALTAALFQLGMTLNCKIWALLCILYLQMSDL